MSKLTLKQQRFADEYIEGETNAFGYVYLIVNLINNKKYIGITTRSPLERFDEHCKADSFIGRAIRKYGKKNFKLYVIDKAYSKQELLDLEIEYISLYRSHKDGYNQTLGGDGVRLAEDLTVVLTERQKSFVKKVQLKNREKIDVNNRSEMIKSIVSNILLLYLFAVKPADKIKSAKMIVRLQPCYLYQVLQLNLVRYDEIKHYANQKLSRFEVFRYGV